MIFKHCEQFDDRSPFQKAFLSCLFSTSTATFILTMTFLKVKVRSQKMKTKEKFCSSAWLISTLINDNQGGLLRRWDLLGFVLVLLELLLPWTLGPSSVAILKVLLQTVTVSRQVIQSFFTRVLPSYPATAALATSPDFATKKILSIFDLGQL